MAKLVLILSLACWLMFAHVVIVCAKPPSSASKLLTKLFSSERKRPRDRTDQDWRQQAANPYQELSRRVEEYHMIALKPYWLDNALKWLGHIKRISPETGCTEQLQTNLLEWRDLGPNLKKFYALLNDYLELYLDVCGYEEYFKKAISNLEPIVKQHPDLTKHPSLYLFVKKFKSAANIASVLSAIKGFSELDRIPEGIDCSKEHETNLLGWIDNGDSHTGWLEFLYDYFAHYLRQCGQEKVYRSAVANFKMTLQVRSDWRHLWSLSPSLYKYLRGKAWVLKSVERLLSAIRNVPHLDSLSEVTHCSEELEIFFSTSGHYPELRELLMHQYFLKYVEKCGYESRFKKVVANIQQTPVHSWRPTAYPTLLSCLKGDNLEIKSDMGWVLTAVKRLSESNPQSKETYCTHELLRDLIYWRLESEKFKGLSIVMGDSFALYLDKCGLEQSFEEHIGNIKQESASRRFSSKHLTLFNYLESKHWEPSTLIRLLTFIRKLSGSNSISKETDCTEELEADMIRWLITDEDYLGMISKQYFAPYLDKCGFEAQFEIVSKIIAKKPNKRFDSVTYPTLYSLISRVEFRRDMALGHMFWVIEELSGWESKPKETYCTDNYMEKWVDWLATPTRILGLHILINDYFELCLDRCGFEDSYQRAITSIQKQSHQYRSWAGYSSLYSYITSKWRNQEELYNLLTIFKKLTELNRMSNTDQNKADSIRKLERYVIEESTFSEKLNTLLRNHLGYE